MQLRYSKENEDKVCRLAAQLLKQGKLIIYPTDTVYGIGADATNRNAVEKVYRLKMRPKNLPLSVMVADTQMLKRYASSVRGFKKGKFTFVIEPKIKLPVSKDKIGFRIPNHWCVKIAEKLGKPVVTTSANVHGKPIITTVEEAKKVFGRKISLYIDSGKLGRIPSKVYILPSKRRIR